MQTQWITIGYSNSLQDNLNSSTLCNRKGKVKALKGNIDDIST